MKKSIFWTFAVVLLVGLSVSSLISSFVLGRNMLNEKIEFMKKTIWVVDYALDYEQPLQEQLKKMQQSSLAEGNRITVITTEGEVLADSGLETVMELDNHKDRREVQDAMQKGSGYATRFSENLDMNLLYVAVLCEDHVVRMAVPYQDLFEYFRILLSTLLVSILVVFVAVILTAIPFSNRLESAEMKRRMEQMEKEKKIRQEFFSNASHELKTPITSVRGYAELLSQDFVSDEAVRKDFLSRILKETDRMATLIDDILMISRLESKDAEVTLSRVNLKTVVEEVYASLEPQAAKCNVRLEMDCQDVVLQASLQQMRELVQNLVSNGIKYNVVNGYVRTRVWQDTDKVWIEVTDSGCGISEEDQARVFERFFRVDKGRSRKMGGTGLGLAIVKHITAYCGGQVYLRSELGKGSCFKVEIPRSGINRE